MHTTTIMGSDDFAITVYGRAAVLGDLFPGFHKHDRLGIIVRSTGAAVGASAIILATATGFYDFYRARLGEAPDQLKIYPETFTFHVGRKHMDHGWMDVWPPHKEVVVPDDPEQILQAVNDRGITRLLVEDVPPAPFEFLRETLGSAQERIRTTLAYSPTGRAADANIRIASCEAAEQCVIDAINASEELTAAQRDKLILGRQALAIDGRVTETYRAIPLSDAILMLTAPK